MELEDAPRIIKRAESIILIESGQDKFRPQLMTAASTNTQSINNANTSITPTYNRDLLMYPPFFNSYNNQQQYPNPFSLYYFNQAMMQMQMQMPMSLPLSMPSLPSMSGLMPGYFPYQFPSPNSLSSLNFNNMSLTAGNYSMPLPQMPSPYPPRTNFNAPILIPDND